MNAAKVGSGARLASLERAMKLVGERLRGLADIKGSHISKNAFDTLRDEVTQLSAFMSGGAFTPRSDSLLVKTIANNTMSSKSNQQENSILSNVEAFGTQISLASSKEAILPHEANSTESASLVSAATAEKIEFFLNQHTEKLETLFASVSNLQHQLLGVANLKQSAFEFKTIVKRVEDELLKIQSDLLSTSGNRAIAANLHHVTNDCLALQNEILQINERQHALHASYEQKLKQFENLLAEKTNPKHLVILQKQIEGLSKEKTNEVDFQNLKLYITSLGERNGNASDESDARAMNSSILGEANSTNMMNTIISQHSADLVNQKEWILKNTGNINALREWMHHFRDKVASLTQTMTSLQDAYNNAKATQPIINCEEKPTLGKGNNSEDDNEESRELSFKAEDFTERFEWCKSQMIKLKQEVSKRTTFSDVEKIMLQIMESGGIALQENEPLISSRAIKKTQIASPVAPKSATSFKQKANLGNGDIRTSDWNTDSELSIFPPIAERSSVEKMGDEEARKTSARQQTNKKSLFEVKLQAKRGLS